jgi:hypothetical protein
MSDPTSPYCNMGSAPCPPWSCSSQLTNHLLPPDPVVLLPGPNHWSGLIPTSPQPPCFAHRISLPSSHTFPSSCVPLSVTAPASLGSASTLIPKSEPPPGLRTASWILHFLPWMCRGTHSVMAFCRSAPGPLFICGTMWEPGPNYLTPLLPCFLSCPPT